ncbi:NAD+ synthase [Legionella waltersii]|nr:NAD+ synthase [Legionella waltersii]
MNSNLTVLMAQINPTVGALQLNTEKIINIIHEHQSMHDVIVFPELAISGYPTEDLLFRKEYLEQVNKQLRLIQAAAQECFIIVGHPLWHDDACYNSLSVFYNGQQIKEYHKQKLPNYGVFDDVRYFKPGEKNPCILEIRDHKLGLCICEDQWQTGPVQDLIHEGITSLISINASPFDYNKLDRREDILTSYAKQGISIIYVNQIGGQDDILFDGQSMAIDKQGKIAAIAPAFEESLSTVIINKESITGSIAPQLPQIPLIYKALVCGTRDYVLKNNFPGVIIGLSGGIDSALTLAIAVDAFGPEYVHAVMMPSRYTASMSNEDALKQIESLHVQHSSISIEPVFNSMIESLKASFANKDPDTTEENIQARIRGMLLMALSNKTGKMVLTTSNKSETAVGYATLYGDMAGGFAVLKDVLKTQVYELAKYRNQLSPIIPERVLTRAPSAELKPNQTDQDSLPDYAVLDAIISGYMENNLSPDELISQGFSSQDVKKVVQLIQRNEYKRRQAAPGIKISSLAFGKDWRYPITNGFKVHE